MPEDESGETMSGKSEKVTSGGRGGIGFCGLLTILFIYLKLTGQIDWSWWWVWSPMWIAALLIVAVLVLAVGGYFVYLLVTDR